MTGATSNEQFARDVLAIAATDKPFRPVAVYDPDGDCIEFFAKPDSFYAERVDDLVTVYCSQETGEVIGSLIKGVRRFCEECARKYPGFCIVIEDGPVRLEHLFLARIWGSDPKTVKVVAYRKLMDVAREVGAEADLCLAN